MDSDSQLQHHHILVHDGSRHHHKQHHHHHRARAERSQPLPAERPELPLPAEHPQYLPGERPHHLPTLRISAPDDMFQGQRDAVWTFQSKHRRTHRGHPDLNPTTSSLDSGNLSDHSSGQAQHFGFRYRIPVPTPHQHSVSPVGEQHKTGTPSENSRMDHHPSRSYRFDLPDSLPRINASYKPRRMTVPFVAPAVVGKEMTLVPQSSFESSECPSDDDRSQVEDRNALSLPRIELEQCGITSMVIRTMQEEGEYLKAEAGVGMAMASSSDEGTGDSNADTAIDLVQSVNVSVPESDLQKTFNSVPASEVQGRKEPEAPTVDMMTQSKQTKTPEKPSHTHYSHPKKKYWKTGKFRRPKDEPVLFGFHQLGCSSSNLSSHVVDLSPATCRSASPPDDPMERFGLRAMLDNYVMRCPCVISKNTKPDAVDAARRDFNAMVNRKQVLDESLYDNYARTGPVIDRNHLYKREPPGGNCNVRNPSRTAEEYRSSRRLSVDASLLKNYRELEQQEELKRTKTKLKQQ